MIFPHLKFLLSNERLDFCDKKRKIKRINNVDKLINTAFFDHIYQGFNVFFCHDCRYFTGEQIKNIDTFCAVIPLYFIESIWFFFSLNGQANRRSVTKANRLTDCTDNSLSKHVLSCFISYKPTYKLSSHIRCTVYNLPCLVCYVFPKRKESHTFHWQSTV